MQLQKTLEMPTADTALLGRPEPIPTAELHFIKGHPLKGPYPDGLETAILAMGCFWGVERVFWQVPGVYVTAAGYSAGITPNPTYEEVCTGRTGHTEVVLVVFDPKVVTYEALLKTFWENHDPTQGMRQGGDIGTQYRSAIYAADVTQLTAAEASARRYQAALDREGLGGITTEIALAGPFYYAEDEHQQYLSQHPDGYCGLGGTGVDCPAAIARGG